MKVQLIVQLKITKLKDRQNKFRFSKMVFTLLCSLSIFNEGAKNGQEAFSFQDTPQANLKTLILIHLLVRRERGFALLNQGRTPVLTRQL